MKVTLLAVGKMKDRAQLALYADYAKRLAPPPSLREVAAAKGLGQHVDPAAFVVVLDQRGQDLTSVALANTLQNAMNRGKSLFQFVLGGPDGLDDAIRQRADLLLAFGKLTWPHLLARIMVLEQIYRAQQILAGHPYHREA